MIPLLEGIVTAQTLFENEKYGYITTGCSSIDRCLKGGIIKRSITEITGEASSGKSQLSLQIAINTILPIENHGCDGRALFVYTESSFPYSRLTDEATHFCKVHPKYTVDEITENIYLHKISLSEEFSSFIETLYDRLSKEENTIRLIVIDSIAALYRADVNPDYLKRSELLRHMYITMNSITQKLNITFIIINQITSSFSDFTDGSNYRQGSAVLPSLGNTVTQFTHNRYMLCRRGSTYPSCSIFDSHNVIDNDMENTKGVASDTIRDFYVLFSPRLGARRCSFTITQDGIVSI